MKNKSFKYNLIMCLTTLVIIVACASQGLCAEDVTQHIPNTAPQTTLYKTALKFLKTMGGVALSSIIIFVGLTFYNKFFVPPRLDGNSEDDVLKTPHSSDEALTFFIKKNKLR